MSPSRPGGRGIDTSAPVVVLRLVRGLYPHGSLGVVRTLGRLGIRARALHDDRWAPAAFSRYDSGRLVAQLRATTPETTVAYLTALGRRLGTRAVLIPTDDVSALFVDDHAEALRPWFAFPERRALARALANKQSLYWLCKRHRVPTPEACFPTCLQEVRRFIETATFPVMVKSIDPELLQQRPATRSTTIVYSAEELLQTYAHLDVGPPSNVMLQEYIPGTLDAHWMVSAYFDCHSDCLFAVSGQKLRESHPGSGFTTLGVCRPNPDVQHATTEFLGALGYRGAVDAEWRYDARDGHYKVLDLNPRVGAQFRALVASNGMDVVRALYLDLTGQRIESGSAAAGHTWVVENHDVLAGALACRRRELSLKQWTTSLLQAHEAAWFARDDPAPFLMMCARTLLELTRRGAAGEQLIRRRGGPGRLNAKAAA